MQLNRAVAVFLLALGFAFGSVAAVIAATEQALAKPCPMEHQGSDCPCCDDDCTGAMTACAAKCAPSVGALTCPGLTALLPAATGDVVVAGPDVYDPFLGGPPPPIPIA